MSLEKGAYSENVTFFYCHTKLAFLLIFCVFGFGLFYSCLFSLFVFPFRFVCLFGWLVGFLVIFMLVCLGGNVFKQINCEENKTNLGLKLKPTRCMQTLDVLLNLEHLETRNTREANNAQIQSEAGNMLGACHKSPWIRRPELKRVIV